VGHPLRHGRHGRASSRLWPLLDELGVEVHLNTEIQEIVIDGKRATGVRMADGTVHHRRCVISNADVAWTYLNMIPKQHRRTNSDRWVKSKKYSMSLFVIYFGTKKRYTHEGKLAHHNIILSERYKGLLRDIFAEQELPEDFSLYLHMPTMTDPSAWRRKVTRRSMCCRRCRIWDPTSIGRRRPSPTATPSCSSWKRTTCPTCRPTSSPSTTSTRCTSRTR
jgi:hypothetical protein